MCAFCALLCRPPHFSRPLHDHQYILFGAFETVEATCALYARKVVPSPASRATAQPAIRSRPPPRYVGGDFV